MRARRHRGARIAGMVQPAASLPRAAGPPPRRFRGSPPHTGPGLPPASPAAARRAAPAERQSRPSSSETVTRNCHSCPGARRENMRAGHEIHHAAALDQVDLDAAALALRRRATRPPAASRGSAGVCGAGWEVSLTVALLIMLVNCVVYQERQKLADIAQSEVDYLAKPGCFVWVALQGLLGRAELEEMKAASSSCTNSRGRGCAPRPTSVRRSRNTASEIFTVLHVVEIAGDELHVGEVNVFTGPNYVLSVRNRTEARVSSAFARAAARNPGS